MSGESPRSTVLIVDDHHLVRGGLRMAFDRTEDLEVVGEAGCVAEALAALDLLSPRVLVTDVGLPDGDGISLVRGARKAHPELGIVVVTMYTSDKELFGALESGASAFVGKDAPAQPPSVSDWSARPAPTGTGRGTGVPGRRACRGHRYLRTRQLTCQNLVPDDLLRRKRRDQWWGPARPGGTCLRV
jgi:CheY-like chemotaxis protein